MLASAEITQKNINSKINQFYTFMTHYTFGARLMDAVSNLLANGKSNDDIIEYIKKEFSSSVLIIDDLIATGGTAEAAAKLVEISKGKVAGFIFVINLFDLGGCEKLIKSNYKVENLIEFPGH